MHLNRLAASGQGICDWLIKFLRPLYTLVAIMNNNRSNTHRNEIFDKPNNSRLTPCLYYFEIRHDLQVTIHRKSLKRFLYNHLLCITLNNDHMLCKEHSGHMVINAQKHFHMTFLASLKRAICIRHIKRR
ncbi:Uncharacterised protein [Burkholderia pseudomallei]|nr:Uncharacterised protein [Burkholderia pseudomallei]CAJ4672648.1 Uncharacterised protein [Burkholderia pseudomallei]CAJ5507554.1 Uncharacterised protein [Burkholderia pseudomallei]CAJ5517114.1 Uncharacterised protein [Burkholderia pseudomallei]CAJ5622696.1 Uncharacterised protein [Burkholderia pseudomallei]